MMTLIASLNKYQNREFQNRWKLRKEDAKRKNKKFILKNHKLELQKLEVFLQQLKKEVCLLMKDNGLEIWFPH